MTIRVERFPSAWLLSAETAWSAILQDSQAHRVFCGWTWACTWWEHFGHSAEQAILGCFDGNDLVAIAPWCLGRPSRLFPAKTLEFIGQSCGGADHLDVICRRSHEVAVSDALAEGLLRREIVPWDELRVVTTSGRSLMDGVLEKLGRSADLGLHAQGEAPYLRLAGDWRGFLVERFDKKRRYNIERQIRLATDKSGMLLDFSTSAYVMPVRIGELFELHDLRKKNQGQSSAYTAGPMQGFHADLVGRLATRGEVVVASLRRSDRAVASTCCFRSNGIVSYFQSGMDPAYERDSVGSTLLALLIKDSFERGESEFDFLRGAEKYKFGWASDSRAIVETSAYRDSLLGQSARIWRETRSHAAGKLRQIRGRSRTLREIAS
jgi:CelD/BcsL family acetyltransferase involved in cellulose biosynthesis